MEVGWRYLLPKNSVLRLIVWASGLSYLKRGCFNPRKQDVQLPAVVSSVNQCIWISWNDGNQRQQLPTTVYDHTSKPIPLWCDVCWSTVNCKSLCFLRYRFNGLWSLIQRRDCYSSKSTTQFYSRSHFDREWFYRES